jgi:DTW domain-containing protein
VSDHSSSTPEPIIANRLFILVLQHPQEKREPLATAALAVGLLRRARLVAGLSWPNLPRAVGRQADPHRWGVAYLGSARPAALAATDAKARDIFVLGRDGAPVGDPQTILAGLDGVVLLDGTWSQAKTLWWRNPWLLKLPRLVLNPPEPARFGQLRREPRREALSTLETAALVLRRVEKTPEAAAALLAALDRLIATQSRPSQRGGQA